MTYAELVQKIRDYTEVLTGNSGGMTVTAGPVTLTP